MTETAHKGSPDPCWLCDKAPTTLAKWWSSTGNVVIDKVYLCDDHTDAGLNWGGSVQIGPLPTHSEK